MNRLDENVRILLSKPAQSPYLCRKKDGEENLSDYLSDLVGYCTRREIDSSDGGGLYA